MGGLERLIGGLLLAGAASVGCSPWPDKPEDLTPQQVQQLDYFYQGCYYKMKAEHEKENKEALLHVACANFEKAKQNRWYDSMLHLADCRSMLGENIKALMMIEEALVTKETANARNIKGAICVRAGYAEKEPQLQANYYQSAFDEFSKAIKLEDNPQFRWNRYEADMQLVVLKGLRFLDYAFEDAKTFTQFLPEIPDGYISQYMVLNLVAAGKLAEQNGKEALEYAKKAYFALDDAIKRIDAGKMPVRPIVGGIMTIDDLRATHKELKEKFGSRDY